MSPIFNNGLSPKREAEDVQAGTSKLERNRQQKRSVPGLRTNFRIDTQRLVRL